MKMMTQSEFSALIKSSTKHDLVRFYDGNFKDFKRDRLEKMDEGKYQVDESKYEIVLHWRPAVGLPSEKVRNFL